MSNEDGFEVIEGTKEECETRLNELYGSGFRHHIDVKSFVPTSIEHKTYAVLIHKRRVTY